MNKGKTKKDKEESAPISVECQPDLSAPTKLISITEAAELNNVSRQAIYIAIKLNKLKAQKESTRWTINLEDLEEYRLHKYSRAKSTFKGELIFDHHKGYYSVNQVARMLNVPAQKIYYATRIGKLKAHRKGSAWVIHIEDIEEYRKATLHSKSKQKRKTG